MVNTQECDRYYDGAMVGLRALEARAGRCRRFGPDAKATWAAFTGTLLGPTDRVEPLLRDAAVGRGLAFDVRAIFGLPATAADDPFGTSWRHQSGRSLLEAAGDPTFEAAPAALGLRLARFDLPDLSATSRLVIQGPSAMAATMRTFPANAALGWDRQVTVVADAPAHSQLAGLCALFAAADAPTRVVRSDDTLPPGTRLASSYAEPAVGGAQVPH